VTADEIPDPQALDMWLDVQWQTDAARQQSDDDFQLRRDRLLVSHFMTLLPGDIITTGTPPGVGMGMKPPTYLKPGDVITLGISGLGDQRQLVGIA